MSPLEKARYAADWKPAPETSWLSCNVGSTLPKTRRNGLLSKARWTRFGRPWHWATSGWRTPKTKRRKCSTKRYVGRKLLLSVNRFAPRCRYVGKPRRWLTRRNRRQEQIRDEAEKLDKQADRLETQAARLESEAAYQPTVIGQIMARNQAAQLRQKSSNLRKAHDRRMKRRERGYEEWTDRVEDRMKELQRDAERRSMEVRRQLEQMRLRRERRLEQYSEARDYLSRSREKERSSSTYFF